jgi:ComF family protein
MVHSLLSSRVPAWRFLTRAVAELLFPDLCPWCARPLGAHDDRFACPDCAPFVQRIQPPFCRRCGMPVDAGAPPLDCARCLAHPPAFDRLRGAVVYNERTAAAIADFKYHRGLAAGFALAGVLRGVAEHGIRWDSYDAIVPVPLHPSRYRRRWFNQAALLVSEMPGGHRLPLRPHWLQRLRDTPRQAALTVHERPDNVRGAFALGPAADFAGRRILLVDDVATTGATLNECAKICRRAGAVAVDAAVVARARTW